MSAKQNCETVDNPDFNSGEFAIIKIGAGLNSHKLSQMETLTARIAKQLSE